MFPHTVPLLSLYRHNLFPARDRGCARLLRGSLWQATWRIAISNKRRNGRAEIHSGGCEKQRLFNYCRHWEIPARGWLLRRRFTCTLVFRLKVTPEQGAAHFDSRGESCYPWLSLLLQTYRKLDPVQYVKWHPGGALGRLREVKHRRQRQKGERRPKERGP